MMRKNLFHVGSWRNASDNYRLHFTVKEFFAGIFWAAVPRAFSR
jgi:hypothetical protein